MIGTNEIVFKIEDPIVLQEDYTQIIAFGPNQKKNKLC